MARLRLGPRTTPFGFGDKNRAALRPRLKNNEVKGCQSESDLRFPSDPVASLKGDSLFRQTLKVFALREAAKLFFFPTVDNFK
jgi:hypothetical protein